VNVALTRGMTMTPEQFTTLVNLRMSERAYQWRIIALARQLGWFEYHTFDSRKSRAGFPDLVLIRERIVYAEVKAERGKTTPTQDDVLQRLRNAGGEVYVWKPSDYDDVQRILQ
jgi:hypothetical protein